MAAREVLGARTLPLVLVALTACAFDARFDGTSYRCGAGGACPDGYACVADQCVAAADARGGDADGGDRDGGDVDAVVAGDAGTDARTDAGPTVRFADDFGDGALTGWAAWDNPGCTVAEANGYLELAYSGTGSVYCGADTNQTFDLGTGAVSVEVVEATLADTFEAYVILFTGNQHIEMIRGTDGLHMQLKLAGQVLAPLTVANDAAARFWRIRGQSGTTFWETSADGVGWTVRHSTTVAVDTSAMRIELAAGHYAPGPGAPVRTRFDRVRVE